MIVEWGLMLLAGAAAVAYGVAFIDRPSSPWRTLVKTGTIGLIAVLAVYRGGVLILIVGLTLSALGDAALEGRGRAWLRAGLCAQGLAGLIYALMFIDGGGGRGALIVEPARVLGVALAVAVFAGFGALAWDRLDGLRIEAVGWLAATAIAVIAAMTLSHYLWSAALGALCLLASVTVGVVELVRGARTPLTGQLAWWPHVAGLALIAAAVLQ